MDLLRTAGADTRPGLARAGAALDGALRGDDALTGPVVARRRRNGRGVTSRARGPAPGALPSYVAMAGDPAARWPPGAAPLRAAELRGVLDAAMIDESRPVPPRNPSSGSQQAR